MLELISLAISDNDISSVLEALAVLNLVQHRGQSKSLQSQNNLENPIYFLKKIVTDPIVFYQHQDYKSVSIAMREERSQPLSD